MLKIDFANCLTQSLLFVFLCHRQCPACPKVPLPWSGTGDRDHPRKPSKPTQNLTQPQPNPTQTPSKPTQTSSKPTQTSPNPTQTLLKPHPDSFKHHPNPFNTPPNPIQTPSNLTQTLPKPQPSPAWSIHPWESPWSSFPPHLCPYCNPVPGQWDLEPDSHTGGTHVEAPPSQCPTANQALITKISSAKPHLATPRAVAFVGSLLLLQLNRLPRSADPALKSPKTLLLLHHTLSNLVVQGILPPGLSLTGFVPVRFELGLLHFEPGPAASSTSNPAEQGQPNVLPHGLPCCCCNAEKTT